MNRFYSKELSRETTVIELIEDEFHHLKNVLRVKAGERVELFNGAGLFATGRIDSLGKRSAAIEIEGGVTENFECESPVKITLFQGLLKGKRNEEVIRDATVLGVSGLCFFSSEHTAARTKKGYEAERFKKWRRIAIEAAKQCGRTVLPDLKGPLELNEAIERTDVEFKIALFEAEAEVGLKHSLERYKTGQDIALLVGPEGGLSTNDLETIRAAGFCTARMGPARLRSEAAARTALSIIGYEIGALGKAGTDGPK